MKTEKRFIQKFIHSESDLPKDGSKYHFHVLGDFSLRYLPTDSASFRQIKKRVDYYLLPLSDKEVKSAEELDLIQYVTNLLYYAFSFNGPTKVTAEFDKWVEEKTEELIEYFKSQSENCNHTLGANDSSGNCLKCGKKVSETINE